MTTDADINHWNNTVATGDKVAIAELQREMIRNINAQIMTEDDNYSVAGYQA